MFSNEGKPDLVVFTAVILLLSIGIVMVFSASSVIGLSDHRDSFHFVRRQAGWAFFGLLAMVLLMRVDYHIFKPLALPGLLLSYLLLGLVLIIGEDISGARRWINLGLFSLQPSELAKLAMVNFAAVYASNKRERLRRLFSGLLPIMVIIVSKALLIMVEPDFGTAAALTVTAVAILFAGGIHLGQFFGLVLGMIPVVYQLVSQESYRMRRIMAFMDPWSDPSDTGWNIIQSLLAVGSGGLLGLGLGASRQKFSYLPEHHTDFIFAIIGEELGFLGAAAVVFLFLLLAVRGVRIALHAPDLYGTLLAIGITIMVCFQAFLNIGVTTGLLPVTGIPLPFISYGGSSLFMTLASMGILLNVSRQSKAVQA